MNFVAAIPLALWPGWHSRSASAVDRPDAAPIALGLVTLVCFYTHVVPFAFLGLGAALVAIGEGWRETLRRWLPLVPAALATLVWTRLAPPASPP